MPAGRPPRGPIDFEDDQVKELLERTESGEPLTRICQDARMPGRKTVYSWIDADPAFATQFRAARARGVHALAEECLAIADAPNATTNAETGEVEVRDVQRDRLRIDTRLRLAGKWLPSIYGDKIDVNHSGEVQHRHDLSGYTADELDALEKLIGKASDASGDQGGKGSPEPGSVH